MHSVILTERWRLVNGAVLYDIQADPAQRNNVASENHTVADRLRRLYPEYWLSVSPRIRPVHIDVGNPAESPTVLCSQDWRMPVGNPPWNFGSIRRLPKVTGPWMVDVQRAGRYRITLRQWPVEADKPVVAVRAKVSIAGREKEQAVEKGAKGVVFEMELPKGKTELRTWLFDEKGRAGGAYFTEVEAL